MQNTILTPNLQREAIFSIFELRMAVLSWKNVGCPKVHFLSTHRYVPVGAWKSGNFCHGFIVFLGPKNFFQVVRHEKKFLPDGCKTQFWPRTFNGRSFSQFLSSVWPFWVGKMWVVQKCTFWVPTGTYLWVQENPGISVLVLLYFWGQKFFSGWSDIKNFFLPDGSKT